MNQTNRGIAAEGAGCVFACAVGALPPFIGMCMNNGILIAMLAGIPTHLLVRHVLKADPASERP
ncbi:MAG: hypothetical protein V2A34_12270 [Lentisphaerota bacterium]